MNVSHLWDFLKISKRSAQVHSFTNALGNSICVPMVKAIIKEVLNQFYKQPLKENNMQNKTLEFLENLYPTNAKNSVL